MAAPVTYKKLVAVEKSVDFRKVAKVVTAEFRQPASDEVIVKTKYVAVTPDEVNLSSGRWIPDVPAPLDLGMEATGTIIVKGDHVKDLSIGQLVDFFMPAGGAYAEYIKIKQQEVFPLPLKEPKADVLPLCISAITAAIALDKEGQIKKGEKVLVTSAAGSTGQFAVQWAKAAGCHVIGTTSSEEKVSLLKDLGCDRPINLKKESLNDVLKTEYPTGIDVVYEGMGGDIFNIAAANLAKKGRLVMIGYLTAYKKEDGIPENDISNVSEHLVTQNASIRGFWVFEYEEFYREYFDKLVQLYLKGLVKTVVDNGVNHPKGPFKGLEAIPDALDYVYSRKGKGKVVVEVP